MAVNATTRSKALAGSQASENVSAEVRTGAAAAAILASGLGSLFYALTVVLAESVPAIKTALTLNPGVGPLSGKTTVGMTLWVASWLVTAAAYRGKSPALGRILAVSILLVLLGLALTFPPIYQKLAGE